MPPGFLLRRALLPSRARVAPRTFFRCSVSAPTPDSATLELRGRFSCAVMGRLGGDGESSAERLEVESESRHDFPLPSAGVVPVEAALEGVVSFLGDSV